MVARGAVKHGCNVPGCDGPKFSLGLCRRRYDMVRRCEQFGRLNPLKVHAGRVMGAYVKRGPWRIALVRCRCGELHLKELGCASCRVAMRRWFLKRALKEALLQTKEE